MTEFLQLVVVGLSTGSAFALVGMSLVLVYRTTGIVNFAQGVFAVIGGEFTFQLCDEMPVAVATLAPGDVAEHHGEDRRDEPEEEQEAAHEGGDRHPVRAGPQARAGREPSRQDLGAHPLIKIAIGREARVPLQRNGGRGGALHGPVLIFDLGP